MVGGDKIDPKFVEYGPLNTVLSVSHDQVYVDIRAPKTRPGVRKIFCILEIIEAWDVSVH